MKLLVNGYSALGATNKEQAVALTLKEIKRQGYKVIGQPVFKQDRYSKDSCKIYVPVIAKSSAMPSYCVRSFTVINTEEVESVEFVDLTVIKSNW